MKSCVSFVLLLCVLALSGREIFVAPYGSDKNPGTSDKPLKKISTAVRKLKAGDTVTILPGEYLDDATNPKRYLCRAVVQQESSVKTSTASSTM